MRISVYITSYNQKSYLIEAINSVLAQHFKPWQIIIVDDFSSDGSQEVIAGYTARYPRLITPIYQNRNLGVSHVRQVALKAVRGDFVTYLDGDDRYLPSKLEKEAKALVDQPSSQIVFSDYYFIDSFGETQGIWAGQNRPPEGNIFTQVFARKFPKGNLFRCELVRYSDLEDIGFYNTDLKTHEDWDMKIRLTKSCLATYVPEPLSEYRRHPKSLSHLSESIRMQSIEYVYRKNEDLLFGLSKSSQILIRRAILNKLLNLSRRFILSSKDGSWDFHEFQIGVRQYLKFYIEDFKLRAISSFI